MRQIFLLQILAVLMLPMLAMAGTGNFELRGRVMNSATNEPLAGASIQLIGSATTTHTDATGYFTLQSPDAKARIQVSYVGFESLQLSIQAGELLEVRLAVKSNELQDVVVRTGYQQLPKERSNGAFEVIDSNLLNRVPAFDIMSKLDGQAGSILANKSGSGTRYTIRGISSMTATMQQPLIVLDNFPYEGNINQINPNDVEQVTVLKDAAAASIWGARAGNGVIVITTKKGRRNSKPAWKFSYNTSMAAKPDLYYLSKMSSSDFIEVEKMLFGKGFYTTAINNTSNRPVLSPVVEWLQLQKLGQLTEAQVQEKINGVKDNDVRSDFLEYLYQPSMLQQLHLQLSGGDQRIQYALSGGYDRQKQNTVGDYFERVSFRSDNNYAPTKWLDLDAGIIFTHMNTVQNSPGNYFNMLPGGGKSVLYPYAALADENGNPAVVLKDYRAGYTDTAGGGLLLDWKYRPLDELQFRDNRLTNDHILGKIGAHIKLLQGLDAELRYQVEKGFGKNEFYYSPETYMVRNMVNRFSQINNRIVKYNLPNGGILDEAYNNQFTQGGRALLNYQLKQDQHQLAAIAGAEIRQSANEASNYRSYGYKPDPLSFVNTDYVTSFPIYGNLSGASPIPNTASQGSTLQRFVSMFANANYTYKDRYSISGSFRKDGSNLFGVNSNQKIVPLWSAGAGWVVSNEGFYKLPWLNYVKLRSTYGVSGNTNSSVTAYSTIRYSSAGGNLVNIPYADVLSPANPDLQWEQVAMFNAAVDFAAFDRRLSGSLEYYQKWADHLLTSAPLDPTTGFTTASFNSGKMEAKGVECYINMAWFRKKFQWSSHLLFNYASSKITNYDIAVSTASNYVGKESAINALEGSAPYGIYAYRWAGLSATNGDPKGYYDGKESTVYTDILSKTPLNQLAYYGSARPPFFGAFSNELSYKAWRLSANISYQAGHYFRLSSIHYNSLYNSWATHGDFAKRWQQPGDEQITHVPSMPYPANSNRDDFYAGSTVLIEKADHIRWQDLRLDYRFSCGHKKQMQLQVYGYVNNVLLIWSATKSGVDPAYGNNMPPQRNYSIGFTAGF
ncbi:MAG TPA: SusC/RagA family TonB-linked outer membrane protein [Phnomibacter sp.]|nr:SusC/RagA family TonB-linked outer membrane protein [Phnomibacter sp.]